MNTNYENPRMITLAAEARKARLDDLYTAQYDLWYSRGWKQRALEIDPMNHDNPVFYALEYPPLDVYRIKPSEFDGKWIIYSDEAVAIILGQLPNGKHLIEDSSFDARHQITIHELGTFYNTKRHARLVVQRKTIKGAIGSAERTTTKRCTCTLCGITYNPEGAMASNFICGHLMTCPGELK